MLNWEARLKEMRSKVSAEIFAYLMSTPTPEPVYLVYFPVTPDPSRPDRNLWGKLGHASGLAELEALKAQGWVLCRTQAIRGDKSRAQIELFVTAETAHAQIIGDD